MTQTGITHVVLNNSWNSSKWQHLSNKILTFGKVQMNTACVCTCASFVTLVKVRTESQRNRVREIEKEKQRESEIKIERDRLKEK